MFWHSVLSIVAKLPEPPWTLCIWFWAIAVKDRKQWPERVGEWKPQISSKTFNHCSKITATHKMQQPWCAQAKQVAGCCLETQRDTTTKAERETELKRTRHGRTRTTQGRTQNCRWLIGISKVRQNQRTQIYWEKVSREATKKNLTATPKITRTRLRLAKWAGNN